MPMKHMFCVHLVTVTVSDNVAIHLYFSEHGCTIDITDYLISIVVPNVPQTNEYWL